MTTYHDNGHHFGEKIRANRKYGHHCTRATYGYPSRSQQSRLGPELFTKEEWQERAWMFQDEEQRHLSDKFLLAQRDRALVNFDLSMAYFATLNQDEFEANLQHVLRSNPGFQAVENLPDYDSVSGAYIMVFDEHRQFYIGKANDIRKRIKAHWTGKKSVDRLIFGHSEYESIFPVDELRCLDTTRIFAFPTRDHFAVEERAVASADQRFCLNRVAGGPGGPLMLMQHAADPKRQHFQYEIQEITTEQKLKNKEFLQRILERHRSNGTSPAKELATLPRTVYRVQLENGRSYLWTLRMQVRTMFVQDELTQDEFVEYLRALGETPILLED